MLVESKMYSTNRVFLRDNNADKQSLMLDPVSKHEAGHLVDSEVLLISAVLLHSLNGLNASIKLPSLLRPTRQCLDPPLPGQLGPRRRLNRIGDQLEFELFVLLQGDDHTLKGRIFRGLIAFHH